MPSQNSPVAPEKPDAQTLDRIDVTYEVTARFVVTAGVYNGVADKENLAELINSRGGLTAEDIDSAAIIEVAVDDEVVSRAA